jgi:hypothetical protein
MRWAAVVMLAGCGRLDFDALGDAHLTDGVNAGAIAWVKTFVGQATGVGTTDTFTNTAAAGDAVIVHAFCKNPVQPTSVSVTAPGWTFVQLGAIFGDSAFSHWATELGAIAPDSSPTTFTVTWSESCSELLELGDEFSGVDPSGGTTTFEAHAEVNGSTICSSSVTTVHANDAIWSACSGGPVTTAGAGYTTSADDGAEDHSEYKLTTDPAGTLETATFNDAGDNVSTTVAIRPAT